jgi:hypothetical protein
MARLNLFIDTTSNSLLAGLASPLQVNPATLPLWFGDTLSLQIYLLNTTNSSLFGSNPYTVINNAGLQLFLYLDDGTIAPGVIYTQQITWQADPTNSYFYSTLSLNTMALQTLLGTATTANASLKVGYVQAGLQTTVLSVPVTIGVGIPSSGLVVPPGLTPLSVEVANNLFVHLDGNPNNPGQGFYLVSPAGKKLLVHAIDNQDGTASLIADPTN